MDKLHILPFTQCNVRLIVLYFATVFYPFMGRQKQSLEIKRNPEAAVHLIFKLFED